MTEQITIEEYNLIDFTLKVAEKASEGYKVDVSNAGAPMSLGIGHFTCKMNKTKIVEEPKPQTISKRKRKTSSTEE